MIILLIYIVILGLGLYLIEQIPMAPPFKLVARIVAVLILIMLLLSMAGFGPWPHVVVR